MHDNRGGDTRRAAATEDVRKFWRHVFGGEQGLIQLWTGARGSDGAIVKETIVSEYFDYPGEAKRAAEWALGKSQEGREVYFCAHLLTARKRRKENAAPVVCLWGEVDGAEVPNGELKPTAVIESSPGRYHLYWRLTDAIAPQAAEDLNERLARAIGADPSGFDLTQLLRVPGTENRKYPDTPEVKIAHLAGGRSYGAADLDRILPRLPEEPKAEHHRADGAGGREEEPPVALGREALKVFRGERPILTDVGRVDRSKSLLHIGRVLYDAGANRGVIVEALRERDEALGWRKYSGRRDADRRYHEIVDELERNGRNGRGQRELLGKRAAEGRLPRTMTAAELIAEDLPPVRWAVPELLPEGVTLLCGKPKLGKSWFGLGLCVATAAGGYALGRKRVEKGDALYLALEDNRRRMQKRLKKVLAGGGAPERLHVAFEWPRLDEGGVEALRGWLDEHPGARLVIIDTLAKIRKPARGQNVFSEDYASLEKLLPLAAEYGVSIVVVHHLRKLSAADPLDEINASTGLSAGVDGFLILKRDRGRHDAALHVEGRDIEEPAELALTWDQELASWKLAGDAEEFRMSRARAEILAAVKELGRATAREVADHTGGEYENVRKLLSKMAVEGVVRAEEKGRTKYYTTDPNDPNDPDDPDDPNDPNGRVGSLDGAIGIVSEAPDPNGQSRENPVNGGESGANGSVGTIGTARAPLAGDAERRLTEEEARRVQRLIAQGMKADLARAVVLRRGGPERSGT